MLNFFYEQVDPESDVLLEERERERERERAARRSGFPLDSNILIDWMHLSIGLFIFLIYAQIENTSTCISIKFLPLLSVPIRWTGKRIRPRNLIFQASAAGPTGILLSDIQTVDRSYLHVKRKSFDSFKRFPVQHPTNLFRSSI